MIKIVYNKNDLRFISITGDNRDELLALEKHFNKTPQYMFLPSFRGMPRPEVFIHRATLNGNTFFWTHAGLWKNIWDWCKDNKVDVTGIDDYFKYRDFDIGFDEFKKIVLGWGINPEPRDYQIKSAWLILKYRRSLSQLATRAGKTLLAYIIFRYMLEKGGAHNILMIVPNIQLVRQGVQDMNEYAPFFTSETVWANGEYCEGANLTIGTFQSLVNRLDKKSKKYNPSFFNKFDVICVDEAHTAPCQSIDNILKQPFVKSAKLHFGFSGSLPVVETIESYACQSIIGPMIQDIRTKELQDEGYIAKAEIYQLRINYTEEETLDEYIRCGEYLCGNEVKDEKGNPLKLPSEQREFTIQNVKKLPKALQSLKPTYTREQYKDYLVDLCKVNGANLLLLEQMLVHRSKRRLRVMDDLIREMDKNVIIFAHHTEYINHLEKHFKEVFPDKKVYKINGSTAAKRRDKIKEELLNTNDAILVASYKCVGTGLTFKNLDFGIFAQSFKSQIINKQSLGRGLCLAEGKEKYVLYDVIDCFPTERIKRQGDMKVKLFKQEEIPIDVKYV